MVQRIVVFLQNFVLRRCQPESLHAPKRHRERRVHTRILHLEVCESAWDIVRIELEGLTLNRLELCQLWAELVYLLLLN